MKVNTISEIKDYLNNNFNLHIDLIRGNNANAFTRNRKVGPFPLFLQMFAQKGKTQYSELIDFYKDINKPLDISTVGFYKARMNFNPEAIRVMSNEFIYSHYKNYSDSLVKLNGYYVLAVDGSDITVPSTNENSDLYGRCHAGNKECPQDDRAVLAKLSTLYDCINHLTLDSQLESYTYGEKKLAMRHIAEAHNNLDANIVLIFDRGYYSIRLVDEMIRNGQKFLFRLQKDHLRRFSSKLNCGEDEFFDVTYSKGVADDYKDDPELYKRILTTTYKLRFAKILINDNGSSTEEILLTNLEKDEFDIDALKELYHLRWEIESHYNVLKNKLKLEEFSGYRNTLVRQDIFPAIWLSNLVSLFIIEINQKDEIPSDRYKYQMKRNTNQIIGVIKSHFIRSLIFHDMQDKYNDIDIVNMLIKTKLVPIRNNRSVLRRNVKNVSRMSYRYSY